MGEKLYNSEEVRAILKAATENTSFDEPDSPIGLSIDELRKLARDAGIDPKQITRAAAEVDAKTPNKKNNFWGGPFSFTEQVRVDNEISAVHWEEMLNEIRDFFQAKGKVTSRSSVIEWSSPFGSTNSTHVTAIKTKGKTKINVSWRSPLYAIPYYIPVPLVAIGSLFLAPGFLGLSAIPGLTFVTLTTVLTFFAGRWKLHKSLDESFKKMKTFVARLEKIASRPLSPSEAAAESALTGDVESPNKIENMLKDIEIDENSDQTNAKSARGNRSKT